MRQPGRLSQGAGGPSSRSEAAFSESPEIDSSSQLAEWHPLASRVIDKVAKAGDDVSRLVRKDGWLQREWWSMRQAGGIFSQEFHVDFNPVIRAVCDDLLRTVLVLGVVLRLVAYLWNRECWLDEASLLGNVVKKAIFDFSSHYSGDQLAPLGFLIIERILVGLLGVSGYVTRFVPLLCGIGSLWLFRSLALRWFSWSAALVAMILFAFSDDMVYY